jgi:hypothetical protein
MTWKNFKNVAYLISPETAFMPPAGIAIIKTGGNPYRLPVI